MKQITVNVPEKKFSFFMQLIKSLGLKSITDADSKKEKLKSVERGLQEVKMIRTGKLPKKKIEKLLREL